MDGVRDSPARRLQLLALLTIAVPAAVCEHCPVLVPVCCWECPEKTDLHRCNEAHGEFCEGDGECGTDNSLDNCQGGRDIYRLVTSNSTTTTEQPLTSPFGEDCFSSCDFAVVTSPRPTSSPFPQFGGLGFDGDSYYSLSGAWTAGASDDADVGRVNRYDAYYGYEYFFNDFHYGYYYAGDPPDTDAESGFTYVYPVNSSSPMIRLVQDEGTVPNGDGFVEGILQAKVQGVWGTVCDDSFTDVDARVACNELGFETGWAVEPYEVGMGATVIGSNIVLDDVNCDGTEEQLMFCRATVGPHAHNCFHYEDVALICGPEPAATSPEPPMTTFAFYPPLANDADVRLLTTQPVGDQPSNVTGLLQVKYHGEWGTVCDDGFTNVDARVACFELGFSQGLAIDLNRAGFDYTFDEYPILLDDLGCSGTEVEVTDCEGLWGSTEHNCGVYENVALYCSDLSAPSTASDDGFCCCSFYSDGIFTEYAYATDPYRQTTSTFSTESCVGYADSTFRSQSDVTVTQDTCALSTDSFTFDESTGDGYKCTWVRKTESTTGEPIDSTERTTTITTTLDGADASSSVDPADSNQEFMAAVIATATSTVVVIIAIVIVVVIVFLKKARVHPQPAMAVEVPPDSALSGSDSVPYATELRVGPFSKRKPVVAPKEPDYTPEQV